MQQHTIRQVRRTVQLDQLQQLQAPTATVVAGDSMRGVRAVPP
jgi:hypothetical protein